MDVAKMHQGNRAAWNEGAAAYEADLEERLQFLKAGGTNFCPPEYRYLEGLRDWCEVAVHLQCAGGTDTLSLWNLGARSVVGVDISERMLEVARRKSEALGAAACWVHSDVLETPDELDGTADLVYTGRGALNWIQDIEAWARVPARLLKPGGRLYVFEGHPFMWLWELDADTLRLDPQFGDYFCRDPLPTQGWPDSYIGDLGRPESEHAMKYERLWHMGDVVNAVIDAGLVLRRLEEHPDPYWDGFAKLPPETLRKLPQTYSLLAVKPS